MYESYSTTIQKRYLDPIVQALMSGNGPASQHPLKEFARIRCRTEGTPFATPSTARTKYKSSPASAMKLKELKRWYNFRRIADKEQVDK